jgi:hypothetical protein
VAGLAAMVALVVLGAATVATGLLVHADAQQRRADQEEALRKERDVAATTEAALRQQADRDRGAAEQAQAVRDDEWFAAAFHLGQLLKDKPDDPDLRSRRDYVRERIEPPTPMDPLPQP